MKAAQLEPLAKAANPTPPEPVSVTARAAPPVGFASAPGPTPPEPVSVTAKAVRAPDPTPPEPAVAPSPTDETLPHVVPSPRAGARTSRVPTPKPARSMQSIHDELLRIARALREQGDVDRASGLVHRALLIDDTSRDAYEAAYLVLREQAHDEAAGAAAVKLVALCTAAGDLERARRYAPMVQQLCRSSPTLARRAAEVLSEVTSPGRPEHLRRRHELPTVVEQPDDRAR